jgi:hypothetical protein
MSKVRAAHVDLFCYVAIIIGLEFGVCLSCRRMFFLATVLYIMQNYRTTPLEIQDGRIAIWGYGPAISLLYHGHPRRASHWEDMTTETRHCARS